MAITTDELQTIISAVLSSIRTNSRTIDQLSLATTISDGDSIEISGGKRVLTGALKEAFLKECSEKLTNIETSITPPALVGVININDLDGMSDRRAYYTTANTPCRLIVKGGAGNSRNLGVLDVISDTVGYLMTQIFTTHLELEDNSFKTPQELGTDNNKVYTYYRSHWGGTAWTQWKMLTQGGPSFMGMATPDTNPGNPASEVCYLASQAGTYTNFGNISISNSGLYLLTYTNNAWKSEELLNSWQGTGTIELKDLDSISADYAKYATATAPCRLVVTANKRNIGFLDIISDPAAFLITEVFTTHYDLADNNFVPPASLSSEENSVHTYCRDYVTGTKTWNRWHEIAGSGFSFMGIATPDTNPGNPNSPVCYLASVTGTYTNFGDTIIDAPGIYILSYTEKRWVKQLIYNIENVVGTILYSELDNMEIGDYAPMQKPCRLSVVTNTHRSIGTLDVFVDTSLLHLVQIFTTTLVLKDGKFSPSSEEIPKTTVFSRYRHSDGWSSWEIAPWIASAENAEKTARAAMDASTDALSMVGDAEKIARNAGNAASDATNKASEAKGSAEAANATAGKALSDVVELRVLMKLQGEKIALLTPQMVLTEEALEEMIEKNRTVEGQIYWVPEEN